MRMPANPRKITLNGIFLALSILALFLATVLPTSRLSFYALSSFLVAVIIIEFGVKAGWMFYVASCIMTFLIIPNKLGLLPYLFFFGCYGIIKFYIEKIGHLFLEYLLKLVFFNACLILGFLFIKAFLFNGIKISLPIWGVIGILEVVFIIYDYVYTLFLQYYHQKLKRILKI